MTSILNIILALIFVGNNTSELNIDEILYSKLKDCSRIEYSIISPKNINLSSCIITDESNIRVEGNRAYLPIRENNKNTILTLNLKVFKNVLVCNRELKRNEELSRGDFSVLEKEVSNLRFDPITLESVIEQYRTRVSISENQILQNTMIEKIPDVKIGDRINAIFTNNSVNISFSVTSRSEGIAGEIVRVKRDDKKIFKAKVINNTTVKIIE
jgi:flagella basal body P-ring formation protein FlgA